MSKIQPPQTSQQPSVSLEQPERPLEQLRLREQLQQSGIEDKNGDGLITADEIDTRVLPGGFDEVRRAAGEDGRLTLKEADELNVNRTLKQTVTSFLRRSPKELANEQLEEVMRQVDALCHHAHNCRSVAGLQGLIAELNALEIQDQDLSRADAAVVEQLRGKLESIRAALCEIDFEAALGRGTPAEVEQVDGLVKSMCEALSGLSDRGLGTLEMTIPGPREAFGLALLARADKTLASIGPHADERQFRTAAALVEKSAAVLGDIWDAYPTDAVSSRFKVVAESLASLTERLAAQATPADGKVEQAFAAYYLLAKSLFDVNAYTSAMVGVTMPQLLSPAWAAPRAGNDDVLYVGMNRPTRDSVGAAHEISSLQQHTAGLTAIQSSTAGQGKISHAGKIYDLTVETGCRAFAEALGLSPDRATRLVQTLLSAEPSACDELGQIAAVWVKADNGGRVPARFVISGHHTGDGPWGDDNGQIMWRDLANLAAVFPQAAAQIEDFMVAGCYSGGAQNLARYRQLFPNLETVWAYTGSAPGSASGATVHLRNWERATRGEGLEIETVAAAQKRSGIRKSENVEVRDLRKPAAKQEGELTAQLLERIAAQQQLFDSFANGARNVENPQSGPLRDYYNLVQSALQRGDLPPFERRELEEMRDKTIRLLFYDSVVRGKFATEYAAQIRAGYAAMGMTPPDFAKLSRAQALQEIDSFQTARWNQDLIGSRQEAADTLSDLFWALRDMDRTQIPDTWL